MTPIFLSCLALIWSVYVQAMWATSQTYSCLRPWLRYCTACHTNIDCFMMFQAENRPFICFHQLDRHIYWRRPFTTHPLARIKSGMIKELIHKYSFIRYIFLNLYYDQQMHNYFTNYHTPTCFDTIVSSSGSV